MRALKLHGILPGESFKIHKVQRIKKMEFNTGSLRAHLLSQREAIIHVVQAEALYHLKQMENFSHCNLETAFP